MSANKSLEELLSQTRSFKERAEILRQKEGIPDLDTIDGLQACNSQLTKIWSKLKELWMKKDEKITGAIVVLLGKMSRDHVIRSKLAKNGVIKLLVEALTFPSLRLLIMRCLAIMASHGGPDERLSVADKSATKIIMMALVTPPEKQLFVLCITVLCHASFAVYSLKSPSTNRTNTLRDADARPLLQLMVSASKHPNPDVSGHAFESVNMLTVTKSADILKNPDAVKCLVGHLRNRELTVRVDALRAMFTMYRDCPRESVNVDPKRVMEAAKKLHHDNEYADQVMGLGLQKSLLMIYVTVTRDFQNAMFGNAQDRDMLKLGNTLYQLLIRSEWGVGDGGFADEKGKPVDLGLGYATWFESLPICIKALRKANLKSEEAAMLEIKYNIRHRRYREAHRLAKNWITNVNTNCGFCYYTLTMDNKDEREGLRWAKKGLKTKASDYIKLGMLFNAVDYAAKLGIDMLDDHKQMSENPTKHMTTAIAYLQSALVDAKAYIDLAPIDDRLLRAIMARYFCLFIAIKGPNHVDAQLKTLQPLVDKFKLVERVSALIWSDLVQTGPKSTWTLIQGNYAEAAKEWDDIFEGRNSQKGGIEKAPDGSEEVERDAPDGLEDLVECLCGGSKHEHEELNTNEESWYRHTLSPHLDESMLAMMTCSFCGNPSAQMKKCAGCG
ncbi:hypothetical protein FRB95_011377, partial [Tulasnella sp. JGI-2019a]